MILILLAAALAGCQTERVPGNPARAQQKPVTIDGCSDNMHDLSGCLLQYYVLHQEFPATLEELRPLVDPDQKLPLTCPVSGKAYLYTPRGLHAMGETRSLVVYDATPAHDGKRWAIAAAPRKGTEPLGLWVVQLTESQFIKYIPAEP